MRRRTRRCAAVVIRLRSSDDAFFETLLTGWRAKGLIADVPAGVFAATLRALYAMSLQRELIGEAEYTEARTLIIEGLVCILTPKPRAARRRR